MSFLVMVIKYWRTILFLAWCGLLFWQGWHHGSAHEKAHYEQILLAQRAASQAQIEKDRATADAQSKQLEALLARQKLAANSLSRRLANEIKKNAVYSSCVIPPDGVRLYNDSISAGDSAE